MERPAGRWKSVFSVKVQMSFMLITVIKDNVSTLETRQCHADEILEKMSVVDDARTVRSSFVWSRRVERIVDPHRSESSANPVRYL